MHSCTLKVEIDLHCPIVLKPDVAKLWALDFFGGDKLRQISQTQKPAKKKNPIQMDRGQ